MKHITALFLAVIASTAFAQSANVYVGGVNAAVVGGSLTGSTSQSSAALVGLSATRGEAYTAQGAIAGGVIGPSGVAVYQFGGATGQSATTAAALGIAGGGSEATGGSGNITGATGFYRTLGVQVNTLPIINPQ